MRHEFRISFAPISMFGPKQTERKACNIYIHIKMASELTQGRWMDSQEIREGVITLHLWYDIKKISHLSEFWVHFWFFELSARGVSDRSGAQHWIWTHDLSNKYLTLTPSKLSNWDRDNSCGFLHAWRKLKASFTHNSQASSISDLTWFYKSAKIHIDISLTIFLLVCLEGKWRDTIK